jgi:TPR repeat protein
MYLSKGRYFFIGITLLLFFQSQLIYSDILDKDIRLQQALGLLLIDKHEEAFSEFLKLANSGNAVSQYEVGCMYLNGKGVEKNLDKALEYFTKAAEQKYDDAYLALGQVYYLKKGYEQALIMFKKAASVHIPGAYKWFGTLFSDRNTPFYDPGKAEVYYSRGIDHKSEESSFLLVQNWIRNDKNFMMAEDLLIQMLKKKPNKIEYLTEYGLLLCKQKRYKETIIQVEKAKKHFPDDLMINLLHGESCVRLRMFDEAKTIYGKCLKLTDDQPVKYSIKTCLLQIELASNPEYVKQLQRELDNATELLEKKKYDQALPKIIELAEKEYIPAQLILGSIYWEEENRDVKKAKKWFTKASVCYGEACYYLGEISYFHEDDRATAIKYWKRAVEKKYYEAYAYLALMYSEGSEAGMCDFGKTERYCNKGIDKGIDFCRYVLADVRLQENMYIIQAKESIEKVHDKYKDNGKCVWIYARVLLRLKKYPEALEQFLNVEKFYPEDYSVKETIGDINYKLKNYKEAAKFWEEAIKLACDVNVKYMITNKLRRVKKVKIVRREI